MAVFAKRSDARLFSDGSMAKLADSVSENKGPFRPLCGAGPRNLYRIDSPLFLNPDDRKRLFGSSCPQLKAHGKKHGEKKMLHAVCSILSARKLRLCALRLAERCPRCKTISCRVEIMMMMMMMMIIIIIMIMIIIIIIMMIIVIIMIIIII